MCTKPEIYELLSKHLGYGDPNAKFWFIGEEERWGKTPFNEVDSDYYKQQVVKFDEKLVQTFLERMTPRRYEWGISKIVKLVQFKNENVDNERLARYISKNSFICNISFNPKQANKQLLFDQSEKQLERDQKRRRQFQLWQRSSKHSCMTFCLGGGRAYYPTLLRNVQSFRAQEFQSTLESG